MLTLGLMRPLQRPQQFRLFLSRALSTLEGSPHIYCFTSPKSIHDHILTLLPTDPPTPELALGTTSKLPPTPDSLKENPHFSQILQSVIAEQAHADPDVQAQAAAMASSSGVNLGRPRSGSAGGGASDQGGAGSGGRGGWVHVSDQRHPPDFGRIAEPEDIFGSVEVDGHGNFVDGHGRYQPSGTYRMVTKEGILGLGSYLRQKLVERLKLEEANVKN